MKAIKSLSIIFLVISRVAGAAEVKLADGVVQVDDSLKPASDIIVNTFMAAQGRLPGQSEYYQAGLAYLNAQQMGKDPATELTNSYVQANIAYAQAKQTADVANAQAVAVSAFANAFGTVPDEATTQTLTAIQYFQGNVAEQIAGAQKALADQQAALLQQFPPAP